MSARLSHVSITASDFAASVAFYDAALAALGCARLAEFGDEEEGSDAPVEAAAWGVPDAAPLLWLVSGPMPTTGAHVALQAANRVTVIAFHAAAVGAGGLSHDAPRRWAVFRRGQFNAIVADPDGNLLEAVAPE